MFPRDRRTLKYQGSAEKAFLIGLVMVLFFMGYLTLRLSSKRFFDFDEYQVLYASASLLRGKALYGDGVGVHFPLTNVVISFLVGLFGFKTATVLTVRVFMLVFLFLTLFFVYKSAHLIWGEKAGLMAVALTLACMVFTKKGIEIRHDVFGMAFNTVGAYFALKCLKEGRIYLAWLSTLFLGMAVASTQKAVVWGVGIVVGLVLGLSRGRGPKILLKVATVCAGGLILPLIITLVYLAYEKGETLRAFLEVTIIGPMGYLDPGRANQVYPFPYTKWSIFKGLLYENPLFYLLSMAGLLWALREGCRERWDKMLLACWAGAGILFYLTSSRPFHQSLLPSIPALGILTSGLIVEGKRWVSAFSARVVSPLEALLLASLLLWPSYLLVRQQDAGAIMRREMQNVSFCLRNLRPDEKVLSFTQQQVFFDPLMRLSGDECGGSVYSIDAECFEQKMIGAQCRVIIFDHRTRYLNKEVQKKIAENFLYSGVGEILVPGFVIPPGAEMSKKIWIEGEYLHDPPGALIVDGEGITGESVYLRQKAYKFRNGSHLPLRLFYRFRSERSLKESK